MFIISSDNNNLYRYTINGDYDNELLSFNSQDSDAVAVALSIDGFNLYMLGNATNKIYQYSMSTAWKISEAVAGSPLVSFDVSSDDTSPDSITFSLDGEFLYILGKSSKKIYQYSLGTAWDITTATRASPVLSFSITEDQIF